MLDITIPNHFPRPLVSIVGTLNSHDGSIVTPLAGVYRSMPLESKEGRQEERHECGDVSPVGDYTNWSGVLLVGREELGEPG